MALNFLKVESNKIVNLPLGLLGLPNLQTIDVLNNRLTSLEPIYLLRCLYCLTYPTWLPNPPYLDLPTLSRLLLPTKLTQSRNQG